MIFLGDIAYPDSLPFINEEIKEVLCDKAVVANLEGPLVDQSDDHIKKHILFNSIEVIDQFKDLDLQLLNLANNHTMDLGSSGLQRTIDTLDKKGIDYIGAGNTINGASKAVTLNISGKEFTFLSFGWEVIQCEVATGKSTGVNPLHAKHVLDSVASARKQNPGSHVIVMFHWNYELERYPQPRHRELAKRVIELGASAVIGHHPHIVNGIEFYKKKPIVYSLGNWFIPHNYFFDGKLRYSDESLLQLAFELDVKGNEFLNHWFSYDPRRQQVKYIESETTEKDSRIETLTPFAGMDNESYEIWFKENRVKKKMLPIYEWDDTEKRVRFKNGWVKFRDRLIKILLKLGLK